MAIVLALEKLFDAVNAQFVADGTNADMTFGWREPNRQLGSSRRIVWVPGDPGGTLGAIVGAKYPYTDPAGVGRPIGDLNEAFTCFISASDDTDLDNERKQYHETRLLYDAWYRAVYLAAHGTFEIVSTSWVVDKNERRFGATIRVIGAILAVIPDAPLGSAPVDTAADITTNLNSLAELEHIEAVP